MGEKIGEVGSTGGSSRPLLPYEQLVNSSPIWVILGAGGNTVNYFERRTYRSGNGC